jgi:hypothetical protein
MSRKRTNIIGNTYGNLKVIEFSHSGHEAYWKCLCTCGTECTAPYSGLNRGRINYCKNCNDIQSKESIYIRLFNSYRRAAELRNHSFELTLDEFKILISGHCTYCGVEPRQIYKKKNWKYELIYNGIDRVNNEAGYVFTNCTSCCKFCNLVKNKFSKDEFKDWITRISNL